MAKRAMIYLEYKYPNEPWKEYDRTAVPAWADTQYARMMRAHSGAQFRKRKEK